MEDLTHSLQSNTFGFCTKSLHNSIFFLIDAAA